MKPDWETSDATVPAAPPAAGKYAVTYSPPAGDQITGDVQTPVHLLSLTVPKDGHAKLTVELPKK